MRLGIRRKLIGTSMLVGLYPLAISLVVILGGDADLQINRIRGSYENVSASCAEDIADNLRHEVDKLVLLSRQSFAIDFVQQRNVGLSPAKLPSRTPEDIARDERWQALKPDDTELAPVLNNELAQSLRLM